jgi:hypothetical protein
MGPIPFWIDQIEQVLRSPCAAAGSDGFIDVSLAAAVRSELSTGCRQLRKPTANNAWRFERHGN